VDVLLITNTMSPYRTPVLNKISSTKNIELTVWYLQEMENNRKWNLDRTELQYMYACLKGIHAYVQRLDMGIHINPGLFFKLIKKSPDIVLVTGYDAPGYWAALMYCKLFKKKFVMWWGSTLESSRVKNTIVNAARRFFFKQVNSFVTYGSEASRCLQHYGVPEEKIVTGYNTVDVKYFYKKNKEKLKQESKPSETINFLIIGQLIPRKGMGEIIEALAKVSSKKWHLSIVGSGPLEQTLIDTVKAHGLEERITFEGYKQKEEVVQYLVRADCLIFPSLSEVWGLVINEGIATGTFVLASKYAGATKDIIVDKSNGLIIDPLDQNNLVESLNWVLDNSKLIISDRSIRLSIWRKLHPNSYSKSVVNAIYKAGKAT